MNLIRIEGPAATVGGLHDVEGIILLPSGKLLPGDRAQVGAYATDSAIDEIEARGASVTVFKDNAQLQADLEDLFRRIEQSESEPPIV